MPKAKALPKLLPDHIPPGGSYRTDYRARQRAEKKKKAALNIKAIIPSDYHLTNGAAQLKKLVEERSKLDMSRQTRQKASQNAPPSSRTRSSGHAPVVPSSLPPKKTARPKPKFNIQSSSKEVDQNDPKAIDDYFKIAPKAPPVPQPPVQPTPAQSSHPTKTPSLPRLPDTAAVPRAFATPPPASPSAGAAKELDVLCDWIKKLPTTVNRARKGQNPVLSRLTSYNDFVAAHALHRHDPAISPAPYITALEAEFDDLFHPPGETVPELESHLMATKGVLRGDHGMDGVHAVLRHIYEVCDLDKPSHDFVAQDFENIVINVQDWVKLRYVLCVTRSKQYILIHFHLEFQSQRIRPLPP